MKLNKLLLLTLTTATLALAACGKGGDAPNAGGGEATPAQEAKVLRVGTNAEFAPFEYMGDDGKIVGFDIDLMDAMAQAGGFKVVYKHQPWDGIFASLTSGDNDVVLSAVTITPERGQSMDFSNPYFEIRQVMLVPETSTIKNTDGLKTAKKVGVVTGQTGDLAVSKMLGATSDKVARYDTVTLAAKALQNGGVEVVVSDSAAIQTYAKNNPEDQFVVIEVNDFPKEEYGIAVRKGDQATLTMLNDALQKVRDSGEYDKVYNQHFGLR
ncbi:MAG: basic amino acid ABC transporter substrate-binding protein [Neisseria sp.]|nr:basic amino acid ABC transporter substrate-binding protein [Neisseria sp.]